MFNKYKLLKAKDAKVITCKCLKKKQNKIFKNAVKEINYAINCSIKNGEYEAYLAFRKEERDIIGTIYNNDNYFSVNDKTIVDMLITKYESYGYDIEFIENDEKDTYVKISWI